jgi:Arc/MetJ-type ribon-helix-helix transcriptional regulator
MADRVWRMNIRLTPEQMAWLQRKVSAGQYSSLEAAAAAAIDDSMAGEADDLRWAKALIDEAHAFAARGEFVSHDQYKEFLAREHHRLE